MAFQQVPRTAQIEFQFLINTTPIVNTMYAQFPVDYDTDDLDTLADACETAAESGWIENMANVNFYVGLAVRGLNDEFDLIATRTPAAPVAGSVVGATLPVNVAFCIAFSAGLTGRSTRGRNYVGGIPESQVGEKNVGSTWADAVVTNYNAMKAAIFAAGWSHVIVSRYHNGAKRTTAETFPVTQISYTDLRVDTRRSRLNN